MEEEDISGLLYSLYISQLLSFSEKSASEIENGYNTVIFGKELSVEYESVDFSTYSYYIKDCDGQISIEVTFDAGVKTFKYFQTFTLSGILSDGMENTGYYVISDGQRASLMICPALMVWFLQ